MRCLAFQAGLLCLPWSLLPLPDCCYLPLVLVREGGGSWARSRGGSGGGVVVAIPSSGWQRMVLHHAGHPLVGCLSAMVWAADPWARRTPALPSLDRAPTRERLTAGSTQQHSGLSTLSGGNPRREGAGGGARKELHSPWE